MVRVKGEGEGEGPIATRVRLATNLLAATPQTARRAATATALLFCKVSLLISSTRLSLLGLLCFSSLRDRFALPPTLAAPRFRRVVVVACDSELVLVACDSELALAAPRFRRVVACDSELVLGICFPAYPLRPNRSISESS